jgi:hypothetical protein
MLLILYTITIFLAALLLLWLQPMVGRMLLPSLGGAPAVWNTAMVFYQATLLGGYAYAHFATKWFGVRRQAMIHLALLVLPLLALPIAIPHGWAPPTDHNPVGWLLTVLAVFAGLPFFIVSTTSPLLQRWFSASGHRHASDPYFLYAASNAGSLVALITYPIWIEPHLNLGQQSRCWAFGYVGLAVLTAVCGLWIWRISRSSFRIISAMAGAASDSAAERLTTGRRVRWLLLAFVPCSLMLSVTTYITSEIAPIPLLWVIPLGIYLLTFILVFARQRFVGHQWWCDAMPFAVLPLIMMLVTTLKGETFATLSWPIDLHLIGLLVVAMVCHGELAKGRPSIPHLTEFYLWISAGGVLGGIFNALLAPVLFQTILEYPATLVMACALMPGLGSKSPGVHTSSLDIALPISLGLLTAGIVQMTEEAALSSKALIRVFEFGVPALLCLSFSRRPIRFALGFLSVLLATTLSVRSKVHTVVLARSFFGISRVQFALGAEYIHVLEHGNTMHGLQNLNPDQRHVPLLYYAPAGPLGQLMAILPENLSQRVAVVGLGAGTVACYAKPGQEWTFYEIDPKVEKIARDPRYFTYLQDCTGTAKIVLGDARLSLERAPDGYFGLVILDAYNSDTIPLHLITREAVALYLRKLYPGGVIAFHVSNRHLHLQPVLASLAEDAGLSALCQYDPVGADDFSRTGRIGSRWVVMWRDPLRLDLLLMNSPWKPLHPRTKLRTWTDDYASVFNVFSWE